VRKGRKSLDTGHQLQDLLKSVARLGLLRADGDRDQALRDGVQTIAQQWFNNMRFAPTRFVHTLWPFAPFRARGTIDRINLS
jgi:hypothetical protein